MQKQDLMQTTANVIQELMKMLKQMKITLDLNNELNYLGKYSS